MRRRDLTAGIVLLVVFVAMLWFGKPRNGVQLRFMRSWIHAFLLRQPAFRFPDCRLTFSVAFPSSPPVVRLGLTAAAHPSGSRPSQAAPLGPPSSAASLPLRLSGGWFARRHLIDPIDLAELLQKLWIAIVQTDDLAELGAVAPFVLHDFAPNFDFPKQQRRGANKIQIFFPGSDHIPT